jgi:hypothetical protein
MSCRAEMGGRVVHPSLECSTVRGKERYMNSIVSGILGLVVVEYPRICSTDLDALCCKISFPCLARDA